MAENEQRPVTKDRSPNFPFISLGRALDRARQFYKEEKRAAAPVKIAADHWGYSPTSSGFLQTVGALKQYGLLVDEGNGAARKIRLSDSALRLLLDEREVSPEREALKRDAAIMPPIAKEVYGRWPMELPSDGTLRHFLVMDCSFNPDTATRVVRIIKENEGFTKATSSATISDDREIEYESQPTENAAMPEVRTPSTADTQRDKHLPSKTGSQIGFLRAGPRCGITILADGEVTQEHLDKLTKYIELIRDGFPASTSPDRGPG